MQVRNLSTGKQYYSKRRKRFEKDLTARSLTFTCYQRYQFLYRDRTRKWLIEALGKNRQLFSVDLWAYVIMPEHVHLLVYPQEDGKTVSRYISKVKEDVGRKAVQWIESNASEWIPKITVTEGKRTRRRFWQAGGGYDRNIDNPKAILATLDYVQENPVRRGLVNKAIDWKWSSARWYAGENDVPLKMDKSLPVFKE